MQESPVPAPAHTPRPQQVLDRNPVPRIWQELAASAELERRYAEILRRGRGGLVETSGRGSRTV